ncbi:MAG: zinc metallopeptidase [Spirochaetes bacterium]|nr:zinc metallopeptidase [Spirochaetota bacterium]
MLFGIDPLYWSLMIPFLLLSLIASMRVKSAFALYSRSGIAKGATGAQIAEYILRQNNIHDVRIERSGGFLSDHYDPSSGVIRLSPKVFDSTSIAAVGVAAHEAGHVLQHKQNYSLMSLRNLLVPTASIGSNFSYIVIFLGFIINSAGLIKIGIFLFAAVVLFQIVTLPVELDASARAKKMLLSYGIISSSEASGVSSVLNAAAWTYVAAAASSIATLFYFLLRAGMLGSDD